MPLEPTRPLKAALIGAGSMGKNHLRVLQGFSDAQVQVVGVADSHEPTLAAAAGRSRLAVYTDYQRMLDETRPDLVSVVVPTKQHYEVAAYALKAGIHALVEKPIAADVDEARALVDLARARDMKLAVGHVERFNPAIVEMKKRLRAESLGKIFSLLARRLGPFPPRVADVGVILDLAPHDLDVMRYLTCSEVEDISVETQRRLHQTHEDLVVALLRFANGAIGVLDINWLTPTKVRELSVTGERGMFLVNYLTQDLYFYENDYTTTDWDAHSTLAGVSEGTMTRLKVQKAEPLRLEYEDVLGAIARDRAVTVTGEDGLEALRLAHRLAKAARG
jgi:UDP-N-acetylglucosamine 3-dehydrogenase